MLSAQNLIDLLGLQPLPREGGYYRETYRSPDRLSVHDGFGKSASTAIYYLLTAETFSALHRLPTDEVYHFYRGDPVHLLQLPPDGPGRVVVLGTDLVAGQQPQCVVPRVCLAGKLRRSGRKPRAPGHNDGTGV
jgi:predicted cupin superfamily sugar epimerase